MSASVVPTSQALRAHRATPRHDGGGQRKDDRHDSAEATEGRTARPGQQGVGGPIKIDDGPQ
jgi:hypothetical protein